ncbi:MAG TPA: alpha/beta hydrolase [Acidisoma sp.]|jgi:acetyl esterase/lipase|uniref:alpha/beta hydrolase n=1 Tax=Acidisoma sp. TaxID=1872115 RepID=UPI002C618EF0|nr:alpha/beta hydrolase [Acidisoma sp.]HTI01920.1 alpha/beta hydrolase [Acidisoma sp.]
MTDLVVTRNLPYATGDRHSLDVYVSRAPGKPRPVVVFVYGGNWAAGSKAEFAWVGAALARLGFMAVIPDYRLYPEARWPMFLQDNADAVHWAQSHAASFGGDPSKIVLMGHSAGANSVLSLAVEPQWLAGVGMSPHDIRAVIGLSGPYTLSPLDSAQERAIFGPKTGYADPIHHIDGGSPPLLLIIGDRDDAADPRDSDAVAAKVRAKGSLAEVVHFPTLGHSDTQNALAITPGRPPGVINVILRFLAAQGVVPSQP